MATWFHYYQLYTIIEAFFFNKDMRCVGLFTPVSYVIMEFHRGRKMKKFTYKGKDIRVLTPA